MDEIGNTERNIGDYLSSEVLEERIEPTLTWRKKRKRTTQFFEVHTHTNVALALILNKHTLNDKGSVTSIETQCRIFLCSSANVCVLSNNLQVCWDVIKCLSQ